VSRTTFALHGPLTGQASSFSVAQHTLITGIENGIAGGAAPGVGAACGREGLREAGPIDSIGDSECRAQAAESVGREEFELSAGVGRSRLGRERVV
jgi:hypothetical protein